MNSVTNKYIWFKCYLNLFKLVADGMRGLQSFSECFKCLLLFLFKKIIKNYNSFLTVIDSSLSTVVTSQDNLSLSESSSIPTICEGMVVLNDFDFGFCNITLDFTSNNFITPFLLFFINIFDNILYIFYL